MLDITRNVWNGTDYLPSVWHAWLSSSSSHLMAAEVDGRLVSLQHVDIQPDGDAWLEGVRVAEDVQGRGVGAQLLGEGLEWARRMGCTCARLATSDSNVASERIAQKAGMKIIASFQPARAQPRDKSIPNGIRTALPPDVPAIAAHLQRHPAATPHGLYTEGWTAYPLTRSRLQQLAASGSIIVHAPSREIEGVAIATCKHPFAHVRIGLITGNARTVERLGMALRSLAARSYITEIRTTVAIDADSEVGLRNAGFERPHASVMNVFEKRLV